MATSQIGTVALHTGYDGEIEELPIHASEVAVTAAELDAMDDRRRAAGISLEEANRTRAAQGLPPLGRIATDRRVRVYRVPAWR